MGDFSIDYSGLSTDTPDSSWSADVPDLGLSTDLGQAYGVTPAPVPMVTAPVDGIPSYQDSLDAPTTGTVASSAPDPSSLPLTDPTTEYLFQAGVDPGDTSTQAISDWVGADDPLSVPSGVSTQQIASPPASFWSSLFGAGASTAKTALVGANANLTRAGVVATPAPGTAKSSVSLPGINSANVSQATSFIGFAIIAVLAVILIVKVAHHGS